MSLAPERANAVTVFPIILSLMNFLAVYFLLKWRRPTTAPLPGLLKCSRPEEVEKANSGYIVRKDE